MCTFFWVFFSGNFMEAYTHAKEADEILEKAIRNHDTRLRINNTLGHLSQLLKKEIQTEECQSNKVKSAEEYFEYSLEIASRLTGNLSDDGYHHLLLTLEHAMLLALESSKDKYNTYKLIILPYFQISKGVGKKVFVANEKIPHHIDLYSYFSTTDYEDIDRRVFVGHLAKACEFCKTASSFYTAEKLWCGDLLSTADCEVIEPELCVSDPASLHVTSKQVEDVLDDGKDCTIPTVNLDLTDREDKGEVIELELCVSNHQESLHLTSEQVEDVMDDGKDCMIPTVNLDISADENRLLPFSSDNSLTRTLLKFQEELLDSSSTSYNNDQESFKSDYKYHIEDTVLNDNYRKYHNANSIIPGVIKNEEDCIDNNNEIDSETDDFFDVCFNVSSQHFDTSTCIDSQTQVDNFVSDSLTDNLAIDNKYDIERECNLKSSRLLNRSVSPLHLSDQINQNFQQN
uniref:Uncharacterized protein n=1 Tax=Arion vulgaris TaxID=1028688 RepID=A0A0B6ZXA8_9EUPU